MHKQNTTARVRDALDRTQRIGPILFCRGWHDGRLQLAALLASPDDDPLPVLQVADAAVSPQLLHERCGYRLFRYEFALTASAESGYQVNDAWYPVNTTFDGDLRLAYVACNGQEDDDRERLDDERNALWRRLAEQHANTPLQLLLHGGDQIYADEMLQIDPVLRAWVKHGGRHSATVDAPQQLTEALRDYLFERYLELYSQPAMAWLTARVPSLAIWDDHDICDGWGSRPAEQLDSPEGRLVFAVAREQFLLFQMAAPPDTPPAICPDSSGETLSWCVRLPGVRIVAPDLRSERRPDRILGDRGWRVLRAMLADADHEQLLVLSSVPAMGPRLSWVEALLKLLPHAQKYEDDLRDQWQSRAHRAEWRAMLEALVEVHERDHNRVTVLSGEIHMATRATLAASPTDLHQLVASGIAHPPPPALFAHLLGMLARLGESPLPHRRVRLCPLPGRRSIYTVQRNYLLLERRSGRWSARWELEHDGPTPELALD